MNYIQWWGQILFLVGGGGYFPFNISCIPLTLSTMVEKVGTDLPGETEKVRRFYDKIEI